MKFTYEFFFDNDRVEVFHLALDPISLNLAPLEGPTAEPEAWTRLENHQCEECRLTSAQYPYCPVARNLGCMLLRFKDDISFTKVRTRVTSEVRVTEKAGALQDCIFPLMGLIMSTSGCPILDQLKPMAFTHLPFATNNETIFRSLSTYLLGQYFRMRNGLKPDWELNTFSEFYMRVTNINSAFAERLRDIPGRDANINALIILDTFAQVGSFPDLSEFLKAAEPFFAPYMRE